MAFLRKRTALAIVLMAALIGLAAVALATGEDAAPAVRSVSFDEEDAIAGVETGITVVTDLDAKFLHMYSGRGQIIKRWVAKFNSTELGNMRVWRLDYAFSGSGRRMYTFRASVDRRTVGDGKSASLKLLDYTVQKAFFQYDYTACGKNKFITVYTGTDATCLHMLDENGVLVKTWHIETEKVKHWGSELHWSVLYNLDVPGDYHFTIRASVDGRNMGPGKQASVKVVDYGVRTARFKESSIAAGQKSHAMVLTGKSAKYLYMYLDGKLAMTWRAKKVPATELDNRLRWDVEYIFRDAGNPKVIFYASRDDEHMDGGRAAPLTVKHVAAVFSVEMEPVASRSGITPIVVTTDSKAEYLHMYGRDGKLLRTWRRKGFSSVSGSMREWNVNYVFEERGQQSLTFRASDDGRTVGASRSIDMEVIDARVNDIRLESDSSVAGREVAIEAVTGIDAQYLHMYSRGGVLMKTWAASEASTAVTGAGKVWKISYPFTAAGRRVFSFRASQDGEHTGNGMVAVLNVEPS